MKTTYLTVPLAALALAAGVAYGQGPAEDGPPPLPPLPKVLAEPAQPAVTTSVVATPDVIASAVSAVGALGDEVVLGRYQVALERMNPQWKERTANRMQGGKEELEKQLAGVTKQMVQQGISMISFKPQGQPRSFEVGPGKKVEKINGENVETLVFSKWLVMVPTVTKFRIIRQGEPRPIVIESVGFQVAIADKGKANWTFIDGSGLSVNDLRSLYVNLPQDLRFPPLERREAH